MRHLEFLRRLRNDPSISRQLFSQSVPISLEEQELWYERYLNEKNCLLLLAGVEESDNPVGYVQLKNVDHINRSVELGFYMAPEHQGRGVGTAVVEKLVELAGVNLNMHRICLEVFATNKKAIHVYEKCGFVREGILRDRIVKDGCFKDVVVMSIIND